MIKVGLIGCGFMGSMHANCYKAMEGKAKVTAVADLREEYAREAAALSGAVIYSEGADLIENADVDFVDICLPSYLHATYAIMAMKKGHHVFVEKPLCLTREEAAALLKVQEETGRMAQVGQLVRFWDEYKWLKQVKDSGIYGKVVSGTFRRLSPRPEWAWENWLHDPKKSGGMALDLHVHDVDYIRYLLGEPKEIRAVGMEETPGSGLTEHILTTYIYDDAVIHAEGCWNYPADYRFSMYYNVKFEKATVVYDSGTNEFVVYLAQGGKFTPKIEDRFEGSAGSGNISSLGGYYNELLYFVNLLENPEMEQLATLKEGARSVELALEGIEKALER